MQETTVRPSARAPVRVFVVDDHEVVRRGLTELFAETPDLEVVGEAATAAQAIARVAAVRPDVAVLDVRLPDGNGIDVCREIRSAHPEVRCLVLTSFDDPDAILAAVMAGASGFLGKQVRASAVVEAVRHVAAGRSLLDPVTTELLLERLRAGRTDDADAVELSERERAVLDLVADGLTNRQIGEHLHLAEKTVKNHVSVLLGKLGMQRRTQAAVYGAARRDR